MKFLNIIKIGLLLSLSWLATTSLSAQVSACEGSPITVSVSNATATAPYVVTYILECGGTILGTSTTGMFDPTALGATVGATCNIYAVNYDPGQTNDLTVIPPTGDCLELISQTLTMLDTPDLTVMDLANTCPATTVDLNDAITDADGGTLTFFESDGTTAVGDPTAVGAGSYVIVSTVTTGGTDCTDMETVTVTISSCDCIEVCEGEAFTSTASGANIIAPYILEYIFECGGTIIATNTTGMFTAPSTGAQSCNVYAVNYDPGQTNDLTVIPPTGDCLEFIVRPVCVLDAPELTVVDLANTCPATTVDLNAAVTDADGGTLTFFESDGTTAVGDPTAVGAGSYVIVSTITTDGTDCTDMQPVTVTINNCDCQVVCGGETFTATVSGANTTAPYVLEYILECGGVVQATNTTGMFTAPAAGTTGCNVYAVNYDPGQTNDLTVIPPTGDCLQFVIQPLCVDGFTDITATTDCGADDPAQTGVVTVTFDAIVEDPSGNYCVYLGDTQVATGTFTSAATANPDEYETTFSATGLDGTNMTVTVAFANADGSCPATPAAATCSTSAVIAPDCAVPVELLYVEAEAVDAVNLVKWATATELDNSHFEIERSLDGTKFETLGKVNGAGTTVEEQRYEFIDANPLKVSYYRLKQIDFSGAFEYSDIVIVNRTVGGKGIVEVFPIPTDNDLTVQYEVEGTTDVTFTLTDVLGRIVSQQVVEATAGLNNYSIDMTNQATGLYFVTFSDGTIEQTRRVIKN